MFTQLLCFVLPILPALLRANLIADFQYRNGSFLCPAEGRYPHPVDCTSYYDCLPHYPLRGLRPRLGRCKAGSFHPIKKKCVGLKESQGCGVRKGRTDSFRSDLSHMCSNDTEQPFVCSDCKTLVHCIEGVAFAQTCSSSDYCVEKEEFKSGICYPEPMKDCSCTIPEKNIYRPDFYDTNTFFFCEEEGSLPKFYQCPKGLQFDVKAQFCTSGNDLPPCSTSGFFALPNNCKKYYSCMQTRDGWIQQVQECQKKTLFSELNRACEDPCAWSGGEFNCDKEGRFEDRTDCTRFYECVTFNGGYRKTSRTCPPRFHWLSNIEGNHGKCISDKDSVCEAHKIPICKIPDGWCTSNAENEVIETGGDNSVDGNIVSSGDGSETGSSGSVGTGISGSDGTETGSSGSDGTETGSTGSDGSGTGSTDSDGTGSGSSGSDGTGTGISDSDGTETGNGTGSTDSDGTGTGSSGSDGSGTGSSGSDGSGTGSSGSDGSGTGSTGSDGSGTGSTDSDGTGSGSSGSDGTGTASSSSDGSVTGSSGSDGTGTGSSTGDGIGTTEGISAISALEEPAVPNPLGVIRTFLYRKKQHQQKMKQ